MDPMNQVVILLYLEMKQRIRSMPENQQSIASDSAIIVGISCLRTWRIKTLQAKLPTLLHHLTAGRWESWTEALGRVGMANGEEDGVLEQNHVWCTNPTAVDSLTPRKEELPIWSHLFRLTSTRRR